MRRILLVDDEPAILEALEDVLVFEGYAVATAHHGEQALELIQRFQPELILTDLMMPVMDGAELLRALGASPELAQIPVVVMSAGRMPALDKQHPFVAKPFELDHLLGVLRSRLEPEAASL